MTVCKTFLTTCCENNLPNHYTVTSGDSTSSFHSTMSHQYTLNTDSPDISMANIPQPMIHRPTMGNSPEENLRYQQELYDYIKWQGNMIQALQDRVQKLDDIVHLAIQNALGGGA